MRHHPAAIVGALVSAVIFGLGTAPVALAAPSGSATTPTSGSSASAPGSAQQKATFGLQPATNGKPDARPYLSYQSSPGGTFHDTVALLNFGTIPLDLQIYLSNLSNAADGSLAVAPEKTAPADAAAWTRLSGVPDTVHIGAGSAKAPAEILLPVSLAVPINASPGDHVAAMVASLETIGKNPKGENVRLLQRVALRIYVRVNGEIHAHYVIEKVGLKYHSTINPFGAGSADVSYTIRNDGNVSVGVSQRVKISGWFGSTGTAPKLDDIAVLLPGNSIHVKVHVNDVWPEVHLSAKVSTGPVRTGTSTDTLLPTMSKSVSAWAIPWPLVVVIVLLIAVGFGLRAWSNSGRRSYSGRRRNK